MSFVIIARLPSVGLSPYGMHFSTSSFFVKLFRLLSSVTSSSFKYATFTCSGSFLKVFGFKETDLLSRVLFCSIGFGLFDLWGVVGAELASGLEGISIGMSFTTFWLLFYINSIFFWVFLFITRFLMALIIMVMKIKTFLNIWKITSFWGFLTSDPCLKQKNQRFLKIKKSST